MIEIKLDKLFGHATNGKVGKINIKIGDTVKNGDVLFQIESSKGNSPFKSNFNGKIEKILVNEGETIKTGDVLFIVENDIAADCESVKKPFSQSKAANFDYFGSMLKPKKEDLESDVTIIGAGPGGYVAALYGAKQGLNVILIEKGTVGGTCLNHGCIPTKALVRSAEVYNDMKNAADFGLNTEKTSVDLKKVVDRKDKIVTHLTQGIDYLLEKQGVKKLSGTANFIDEQNVFVKTKTTETTIKSKNIIIATGSKTANLPIKGINSPNVLDSTSILNMTFLPKSLVIIGGGVIGMEFAFIYAHFGVEVSVVEYAPSILFNLDDDCITEIASIAKDAGIKLYTNSKVEEILEGENCGAIVSFIEDGKIKYITADKVLTATGRVPNTDDLDIENANIEMNENRKGIKVDSNLRTNVHHIYAIGDVTNILQLAHVASHQGIIAIDNILEKNKEMNYTTVPSAIFTSPEIASIGVTEKIAKEQNLNIEVGNFPLAANGKALTFGESRGFIKLIKDKSNDKLLGCSIIGPHASDLIATITVAVNNGLTSKQLTDTIFAHPTTSEIIHEAALSLEGGALHFVP